MNTIVYRILFLSILVFLTHQQSYEDLCYDVDCPPSFKCHQGVCIRQHYPPKKKLCPFTSGPEVIKCTNRDYQCVSVQSSPNCGYSFQGKKISFSNDCQPCLDKQISFYYPRTCSESPEVCNPNEECVNSKCIKLFENQKYKDYKTCSSNSQCRAIVQKCIAGKCVKITELAQVLRGRKDIPSLKHRRAQ